jgi:hypothetical protein
MASKIAAFLGINTGLKPEVSTRRISADPTKLIENFDSELVPAMKKAGYGKYLEHRGG